jgi:hypothetical protein
MSTGRLTVIGLSGLVLVGAVLVAGMLIGQQAMAPVQDLNSDAGDTPVEGETGTPTPSATGAAELSSPPEGFVEFRDEEAGFRILHPEDWSLQSPEDPEVRFLATPNARDSILVRVTPIDLGELEGDVSDRLEFDVDPGLALDGDETTAWTPAGTSLPTGGGWKRVGGSNVPLWWL